MFSSLRAASTCQRKWRELWGIDVRGSMRRSVVCLASWEGALNQGHLWGQLHLQHRLLLQRRLQLEPGQDAVTWHLSQRMEKMRCQELRIRMRRKILRRKLVPMKPSSKDRMMTILWSDILGLWSNRLSIGGSTSGIFRANLDLQDFVAGAVFGEVGGWLDWLRAMEMTFHMWRRSLMTWILCGRCSIWWGWGVTWLASRIGNEVSYVTQIIDDIDFVWQVQYLVRLEGDLTCSTHWKWAFICDADHRWRSFCVAGAVFGEVGGRLYLLHALEMSFHLYCVYIPPENEYICCHLPICSPNNLPQTHYPLEDGSLVTHAMQ